jgi:hypothetical protein
MAIQQDQHHTPQSSPVAHLTCANKNSGPIDQGDDLLDLLENGYARESVAHECALRSTDVDKFCFKRIGKEIMQLHTDTGKGQDRFMLCAKKFGDDFHISPYVIDSQKEDPKQMRCCAVLKKCSYGSTDLCYKLYLDEQWCSNKKVYEGVCEPSEESRLLAEIWHSSAVIKEAEMVVRTLRVTLPVVHSASLPDRTRSCCASTGRSTTSTSTSSTCSCVTQNSYNTESRDTGRRAVQLTTKLPRWVSEEGFLAQSFQNERVRACSGKNFILTSDTNKPRSEQQVAMQFGKRGKGEYVLDHTGPLSTIQAFAIALSMCNWIGEAP